MIFTEKTRQEILGTLVLIFGVVCVAVFFLLESPSQDPEIYQILVGFLSVLISLAIFEAIVLVIHYRKTPLELTDSKFNPPV
jgi:glycerol uptake facilitator-like aquaporin